MNKLDKPVIYIDGASRSNPGEASCGFAIISPNGDILYEGRHYLGVKTNNEAEYSGLIFSLRRALQMDLNNVLVRSDSELLVKQVHGLYKVKQDHLKQYKAEVDALIAKFKVFEIEHVARAQNKDADRLANEALDHALAEGIAPEDVFITPQDSLF